MTRLRALLHAMRRSTGPAPAGTGRQRGRRVLAVLECRATDDAVRDRAVEVATSSGGYLTLVCVVPRPAPWLNAGPYCSPRITAEELREHAAATLSRAVSLIPRDVPLLTALDEGRTADVIRRRVEVAAHDLVIVSRGRSRVRRRLMPAPTLAR
jgi:nucleotide-binding universal stress UspA family protein